MACDIHSVAQIIRKGEWETVRKEIGGDKRNEFFFQFLKSQAKGLPEDFLVVDKEYHLFHDHRRNPFWLGDHNHGWFLLSDLMGIKFSSKEMTAEIAAIMTGLNRTIQALTKVASDYRVKNARFVFGFDS